ncbi:MAG: SpoIIE family protein phosphatase [Nitrospirota bacterium]|nr:SpoIIE family protein phosphatase [Nitrospirota bacterium]MDH5774026.1 SpoIIE family protein phosphatase [Nitrospirota bacterium]
MTNHPMHLGLILMATADSPDVQILVQSFSAFGFQLTLVPDGETTLTTCDALKPDLIFLDVTLPGLSGFDTCLRLKEQDETKDIPVIFVTAPSDSVSTVKGFSVGAVDYVTRPFQVEEVIARITTHLKIRNLQVLLEEIIENLQSEVAERKRTEEALQASMLMVQQANDRMKNDLAAAARVQQALLPDTLPTLPSVVFAWTYQPCSELGGDSLNVFQLDADHVGMYVLDVSGHGVSASLLSVTLSRVLIPRRDPSCLFIKANRTPEPDTIIPPAEIAIRLNRMFPMSENGRQYFTWIYGILNIRNGVFRYTCAGHPPPLYLAPHQQVIACEIGNVPIGLFEESQYEEGTIKLEPGGRLFLYSDGILEAKDPSKEFFGETRLQETLKVTQKSPLQVSVDAIAKTVLDWTETQHAQDDLSILAFEWAPSMSLHTPGFIKQVVLAHQFPARAKELGPLRAMTRMALNNHSWHSDKVEDIVLAIDEACQNIIRHAYHGECDDPITLHIELTPKALVVILEDQAPVVSPDCMNPRAFEDIRPGGLGCHFMRQVMDTVSIKPSPAGNGNRLRMVKAVDERS